MKILNGSAFVCVSLFGLSNASETDRHVACWVEVNVNASVIFDVACAGLLISISTLNVYLACPVRRLCGPYLGLYLDVEFDSDYGPDVILKHMNRGPEIWSLNELA